MFHNIPHLSCQVVHILEWNHTASDEFTWERPISSAASPRVPLWPPSHGRGVPQAGLLHSPPEWYQAKQVHCVRVAQYAFVHSFFELQQRGKTQETSHSAASSRFAARSTTASILLARFSLSSAGFCQKQWFSGPWGARWHSHADLLYYLY